MRRTIQIRFDGGCRPTNPGNKYGSYEVHVNGIKSLESIRFELGFGTNNEAEFESLIAALDETIKHLVIAGFDSQDFGLKLLTDSIIVRNRINGRNKKLKSEPELRMYNLNAECLKRLIKFKSFDCQWRSRIENVAAFGH